mgnify:CR=1 FL=1
MILMLNLILSIVFAGLIHEMGHYLVALTFGHHLVFRRQGFRFIWDMPEDTPKHQRLIALSGFGVEILFSPLLYLAGLWLYPWIVAVHLMAYPFYAGDYNDFGWGKWDFSSFSCMILPFLSIFWQRGLVPN